MPVSAKVLGKQVMRLLNLPYAPTDEEKFEMLGGEYRRILLREAADDGHLMAIVDELMEKSKQFPSPAEVLEMCHAVAPPGSEKAPMGCSYCAGSGYKRFTRMVRPDGCAPYEAEYSTFCSCALGQFYRDGERQLKVDRERKARK